MPKLNDALDSVRLDTPLLVRLLERCREDIQTDADLHFLVEGVLQASQQYGELTMLHYDFILAQATAMKTGAVSLTSVQARLRRQFG